MSNLFSKIFGGKKNKIENDVVSTIESTLRTLIDKSALKLEFELKKNEPTEETEETQIDINFFGEDGNLLTQKDGQLLDAFQLFVKRVSQHRFPEERVNFAFDCDGFREDSNQALMELVDRLKKVVIEKGKSVYCRSLPPKDRKFVHQYVAKDDRIRSCSVGEGLYKKVKIFPNRNEEKEEIV